MRIEVACCEGVRGVSWWGKAGKEGEEGAERWELVVDGWGKDQEGVEGCFRSNGRGMRHFGFNQGFEEGGCCCYVSLGCFKRIWSWICGWPGQGVAAWLVTGHEEEAESTHCRMYALEIICDCFRREDVVPILAIREVIAGEIGSGQNQLVVNPIKLHVL